MSFWEPAKWVAKTRRLTTGRPVILLLTQMEAGHAGLSGVYAQLRETALQQAFLLGATCVATQRSGEVGVSSSGLHVLTSTGLCHDRKADSDGSWACWLQQGPSSAEGGCPGAGIPAQGNLHGHSTAWPQQLGERLLFDSQTVDSTHQLFSCKGVTPVAPCTA